MDVQGAARKMTAVAVQRVAFRTDASLLMGSGHLMRCLTLADALKAQGAQCHFLSRAHPGHLLELIRQRGFAVTALPAEPPPAGGQAASEPARELVHASWLGCDWQTDAEQTRAIVATLQPDWLVVDHYALDRRWEAALQPHYQKLLVIDDLTDRPHCCDVLLNQNLGRHPQDYASLVPADCKVLTGPRYALLRPEFAALRAYSLQRRQQPALKQLLVTMGGVDLSNATGQVLQALKACALPHDCRITVVMGATAPWLAQVRALAAQMPWPTEVLLNIDDMAQRMADSDLSIGAAGSTSWERCCLGLPALMVVLADNQRDIAGALQDVGAAKTLDSVALRSTACEVLAALLADTRALAAMSVAAARTVDGLGAAQVVSCLSVMEQI